MKLKYCLKFLQTPLDRKTPTSILRIAPRWPKAGNPPTRGSCPNSAQDQSPGDLPHAVATKRKLRQELVSKMAQVGDPQPNVGQLFEIKVVVGSVEMF